MKIPVSWIKEYIEYNVSNEKIAELLTMSGTEVSNIIKFGNEWASNIIIGEIKKIDKHPNADRLSLVDVDNSQNIVKVVCGAPNIQVGQKIALAQPGAKLYNPYEKKISVLKKSKIRGIESNGMICSALELNYSDDHDGILILDPNFQTGESLHSLLAEDIFDFEITPNRADCLSIIGIFGEIASILKAQKIYHKIIKWPDLFPDLNRNNFIDEMEKEIEKNSNGPIIYSDIFKDYKSLLANYSHKIAIKYGDMSHKYQELNPDLGYKGISIKSKQQENFTIKISDNDCNRYSGISINSININKSPFWIKDKLIKSGLRPISNIVDITNFVMLEFGQPMHAFDLSKIKTNKIEIKKSTNNQSFLGLDQEKRELSNEMLTITDGKNPIGLAGIIGGENSEIDQNTTNIFLESASFNMANIRQTSKDLNLSTDASYRFERGVANQFTVPAIKRAMELIQKTNDTNIEIQGFWDEVNPSIVPEIIGLIKNGPKKITSFSSKRYKKIIGENVTRSKAKSIFQSLGFKPVKELGLRNNEYEIDLLIPFWRNDIELEDDLIEEIARIIGYDNLSSTPMLYPESNVPLDNNIEARNDLRSEMKSMGYLEVINYPVINNTQFNSTTNENIGDPIELQNPTNQKNKFMRPNLRAGLIDNLSKNSKNYSEIESWKFYELGRTYISEINSKFKLPIQNYSLGIIAAGNYENKNWANDPSKLNFYILKSHVEKLLHNLKIEFNFSQNENTDFYSNKSANIISNNKIVGSIGFINEKKLTELNSKIKDVLYAELNLDNLLNNNNQINKYQKTSAYPQAIRDLSLRVDKNILSDQISDIIKENPLVTDLNVIDVYNDLEPEKKSITFRITFQSFNETLNNNKIDESQNKILKKLKKLLNIELRKI